MSPSISAATAKYPDDQVSVSSAIFRLAQQALPSVLLAALVFVSYGSVVRNGFVNYDDEQYIVNNLHVRGGLTWSTVRWAFTTYDEANWAPLSWLSHAVDWRLFGLHAAGHHAINVLLHAVNGVLLFLWFQRVTGMRWRSVMVAALFAVHPINVESVAWAAERKNVLSMLFFVLALHAYTWFTKRPSILRYAAVFVTFALGLLSKSQVITLPFLLLLFDYWPLRRMDLAGTGGPAVREGNTPRLSAQKLVLEKLPLMLLSVASAVITMKAERSGGALFASSQFGLLLRLETALISYVRYLGKAVWPSTLAALYPHPTKLYPFWQVLTAALLLVSITVAVVRARHQPYLAVGWFWFLGSLVPMIGIVQVGLHAMADRFAYIPFIGLFVMVIWAAADWAKLKRISARQLAIPAACCVLALGILTFRQVCYWRDTPALWTHTLSVTDSNYVAHDMFGAFLANQGRVEEAAAHFRGALAIRPDDLPAELNLGTYEHARGNFAAAIERYRVVSLFARDAGTRAMAYGNMGSAYRQMGDLPNAKLCYEAALQLAPDREMAMIGLGLIAQKNGDSAEAVRQYSHAMTHQPTDVGFLLLAGALRQDGRVGEAVTISRRVSQFSPNLDAAQKEADLLLSGK